MTLKPTPPAPITPAELEEMKTVCWDYATGQPMVGFNMEDRCDGTFKIIAAMPFVRRPITEDDCRRVINAVQFLPRCIAEIERLRKKLEEHERFAGQVQLDLEAIEAEILSGDGVPRKFAEWSTARHTLEWAKRLKNPLVP